jgi:hypothetical protein
MEYIKIESRNSWLIKEIPNYHPDDPRHTLLWREYKKKCIEGLWGKDFEGYRFMPGNLFFYINFCIILDADKKKKARYKIKPLLRDLEWERAYMCLEAYGFSGFADDEYVTCNHSVRDYLKTKDKDYLASLSSECYKGDGSLKDYIEPREYLRKLHSQPLGKPLYHNNAKNTMELGSRGGGKSYWYSLGVNLYELLFDGAKEYTEETRKNPATIEVLIGAAIASKSSEFCAKIKLAMDELATNPILGCWGKPGDDDYQPSPFYKDMAGSLEPNNAKNPYIHKYSKKVNGRWVDGFGSGSKILHTTFTQENPEAGAGTRPVKITVEEVGLVPNVLTVHQSNDAAQNKDDVKFGSSHYLGTAGNIDKIIETRIMFTEPEGYDILAYNDDWEHTGKIGFFLPAYYTNNTFKDEHGNTNVEKAKAFYEKRRADAKKVSSQKYDGELMNYPLVPSEMFLGREGKILPITELKEREKQLLLHNNYKKIGTAIDIYFDSSKPTGVDYKTLENTEPIYEFPTKRDANIEGCIMMYQAPIEVNGKVPNDLYDLIGFDPYVSENLQDGESLGAVYVMKNPKYLSMGYGGNEIVCGYVGKHSLGRTRFLENVEKIMMMYGNPLQGLWFEGNRGDYVKGYFEKKYKLQHLCLRPNIEKGVRVINRPVQEYGWITGNRISKIQLLDMFAEWLKEETIIDGVSKRNLERLPDIALVRECIAFDLDKGNYDRIFAAIGCVVGLREKVNQYEKQIINKNNPLALLANNDNLFNRHNHKLKKRKALLA